MKRSLESWKATPVYRTRPLPAGELRGHFLLVEPVIAVTRDALTSFALDGIRDGGHEGMAFWAGYEAGDDTVILQAVVPNATHSNQRVMASAEAVGDAARAARHNGLGILCQVHSHPGDDARHSDGDDELVLLPFEGMLSIVVPNFGFQFDGLGSACVHQFQSGRWVLCSQETVRAHTTVIPSRIDLRV